MTYQEFASYWPTSTDEPFASHLNNTPKFVVSSTLEAPLEWQNSTLIKDNVAEEILLVGAGETSVELTDRRP